MARDIIEPTTRRAAILGFSGKCHICGYSFVPALRVHHIVPVVYGGKDALDNYIVLCANCHALTHYYSSKRWQGKSIEHYVTPELTAEGLQKLRALIERIETARMLVEGNRGVWTDGVYTLDEAIETVAQRSHYATERRDSFARVVRMTIDHIPTPVAERASFRLLGGRRYISVNVMNYLLFRAPAYGDLGGRPHYDCYAIFPAHAVSASGVAEAAGRVSFRFKHFDCVSLGLFFEEMLSWADEQWGLYQQSCIAAMNARRTRDWVSNIKA